MCNNEDPAQAKINKIKKQMSYCLLLPEFKGFWALWRWWNHQAGDGICELYVGHLKCPHFEVVIMWNKLVSCEPLIWGGLFVTASAAAAAKLLQSCLTPHDPIDGSPQGSPIPGILQARRLEWVAIAFSLFYMVKGKFLAQSAIAKCYIL